MDLNERAQAFADELKVRHGLHIFYVTVKDHDLTLHTIRVARQFRKEGRGTAAITDLCTFADQHGLRIRLTLGVKEKGETTSRARLIRFYKRFGFVENKGRHKNFTLPPGMYREPLGA